MNIVFCVDRAVLPGLHVAAYSLLDRISLTAGAVEFSIFSDALDEVDMACLRQTLGNLGKAFKLELRRVEASVFAGFPELNGSWATYYRLYAAQVMEVERFLYVDADTLSDVDISELQTLNLGASPAAWVPEAPLAGAADRVVATLLGNDPVEPYFNAGVILVNVPEWRRQQISERAMEYLAKSRPDYWDQSALNVVLHKKSMRLDERFNCIANMRKHWPALRQPAGKTGRLIHFLDYPKPWDLLGEVVHPLHRQWRAVLAKTEMKNYRSWHATPARKFPKSSKAWRGYGKVFKDCLLFNAYSHGWLKNVKGVPTCNPSPLSSK